MAHIKTRVMCFFVIFMNSHSRAFDSVTDTLVTLRGSHARQSGTKSRILSMFPLVSSANHLSP
jgi:hypothetical protein